MFISLGSSDRCQLSFVYTPQGNSRTTSCFSANREISLSLSWIWWNDYSFPYIRDIKELGFDAYFYRKSVVCIFKESSLTWIFFW